MLKVLVKMEARKFAGCILEECNVFILQIVSAVVRNQLYFYKENE